MINPDTCPKCGAELGGNAPAGLCPRCLMEKGVESTVGFEPCPAAMPEPDERFGPYRIRRLLGKGGMGAVYEAEHVESSREVALKVLNHKLESPAHRQRFLREGRLAAAVNHPNNVYIYGTEEIDGTPVISMELARGGTLQDRVQRGGPLPIAEAVDAILDIVAGLEAAEAAGVLHRDVKPSNCFLDTDGTVKIGDFGLSISTASRAEINLTQSGVFLGTPAFSSPEQLRGDELDVRSDIYSVGVTLYYLLTGETPFPSKQMVQLLASVLDRPAPSPKGLRPEVPSALEAIVLRCLTKQPAQRFRSYDALRHALLPYSSTAPTPATLGFRVLAYGIDLVVLVALGALLSLLGARDLATWNLHLQTITDPGPRETVPLMLLSALGMILCLGYFTLLEGIWGASAGKAICRLRVLRSEREAPGLMQALVRSSVFWGSGWLLWWIWYLLDPQASIAAFEGWMALGNGLVATVLLFSTMRRSNGYAGVHELASGTRVVRIPSHEPRPRIAVADEPLPELDTEQRVGPYHVLARLDRQPDGESLLAYDTRLLRKVWVRTYTTTTPSLPRHVRDLARIGRLRWLGGDRSVDGGWDAYEAPSGSPLSTLIRDRQPWQAIRFWLLDLAVELDASLDEGSVPSPLSLDRIWITADGRAKLLDFPAPGIAAPDAALPLSDAKVQNASGAALFLRSVAISSLDGRWQPVNAATSRDVSTPIPLDARTFLNRLGRSPWTEIPVQEFLSLTRGPASVSSSRRAGALVACWLFPALLAAMFCTMWYSEKQILDVHPEVGELAGYIDYYESLQGKEGSETIGGAPVAHLREAIEVVVAHRFRSTIADEKLWATPGMDSLIERDGYQLVQRFVAEHPEVSQEQVVEAERTLENVAWEIQIMSSEPDDIIYGLSMPWLFLSMLVAALIVFVIIPSLVSAVLFGDSPLLRCLDIAIVTRTGEQASRWRVFWRNSVLWFIVLSGPALLIEIAVWGGPRTLVVLIVFGLSTIFTAQRGLQDRLAGTWLVPR